MVGPVDSTWNRFVHYCHHGADAINQVTRRRIYGEWAVLDAAKVVAVVSVIFLGLNYAAGASFAKVWTVAKWYRGFYLPLDRLILSSTTISALFVTLDATCRYFCPKSIDLEHAKRIAIGDFLLQYKAAILEYPKTSVERKIRDQLLEILSYKIGREEYFLAFLNDEPQVHILLNEFWDRKVGIPADMQLLTTSEFLRTFRAEIIAARTQIPWQKWTRDRLLEALIAKVESTPADLPSIANDEPLEHLMCKYWTEKNEITEARMERLTVAELCDVYRDKGLHEEFPWKQEGKDLVLEALSRKVDNDTLHEVDAGLTHALHQFLEQHQMQHNLVPFILDQLWARIEQGHALGAQVHIPWDTAIRDRLMQGLIEKFGNHRDRIPFLALDLPLQHLICEYWTEKNEITTEKLVPLTVAQLCTMYREKSLHEELPWKQAGKALVLRDMAKKVQPETLGDIDPTVVDAFHEFLKAQPVQEFPIQFIINELVNVGTPDGARLREIAYRWNELEEYVTQQAECLRARSASGEGVTTEQKVDRLAQAARWCLSMQEMFKGALNDRFHDVLIGIKSALCVVLVSDPRHAPSTEIRAVLVDLLLYQQQYCPQKLDLAEVPWIFNLSAGVETLLDDPASHELQQEKVQKVVALACAYYWARLFQIEDSLSNDSQQQAPFTNSLVFRPAAASSYSPSPSAIASPPRAFSSDDLPLPRSPEPSMASHGTDPRQRMHVIEPTDPQQRMHVIETIEQELKTIIRRSSVPLDQITHCFADYLRRAGIAIRTDRGYTRDLANGEGPVWNSWTHVHPRVVTAYRFIQLAVADAHPDKNAVEILQRMCAIRGIAACARACTPEAQNVDGPRWDINADLRKLVERLRDLVVNNATPDRIIVNCREILNKTMNGQSLPPQVAALITRMIPGLLLSGVPGNRSGASTPTPATVPGNRSGASTPTTSAIPGGAKR